MPTPGADPWSKANTDPLRPGSALERLHADRPDEPCPVCLRPHQRKLGTSLRQPLVEAQSRGDRVVARPVQEILEGGHAARTARLVVALLGVQARHVPVGGQDALAGEQARNSGDSRS